MHPCDELPNGGRRQGAAKLNDQSAQAQKHHALLPECRSGYTIAPDLVRFRPTRFIKCTNMGRKTRSHLAFNMQN
jgi:hypothetical protein